MLEKIKKLMIFFVVALVSMGVYVILGKNVIDVIYMGVLGYYFCRFLRIRKNGK